MSVTFERANPAAPHQDRTGRAPSKKPTSRSGPAPRPSVVTAAAVVVGLGLGATVGIALTAESVTLLEAPGGIAMFLGNLTGLVGTYLALVMVLLVSRLPQVERVLGQDGLLRWHRRLSPWPISLIIAHAVLLTYAYAVATRSGLLQQLASFISSYSGMLIAIIGFGIFVVVAGVSVYSVRRRLRRETWWAIHLGMYLAFALAFAHEIVLGPSFVGHPLTQAIWSAAWAATAGFVLAYRFGLPIVRSIRFGLRVEEIRTEADGIVSVICRGRNLEKLAVSGGQFFEWRFLTKGMWWQAHPYSLSARPQPPHLRLTVKSVGDHSRGVATLKPGTRVAIEGPYGSYTTHARSRQKVAFVVGGIGVTAARSMLEDLPRTAEPIVVWRVSSADKAALETEVRGLVSKLRGRLHVVAGSRQEVEPWRLGKLIPDIRKRDVFVSGSEGFVGYVVDALHKEGVPEDAIHYEVYAL
ncbi:MAG: ferredoxin reductase family protein [Acidimicrobiales bacterium]